MTETSLRNQSSKRLRFFETPGPLLQSSPHSSVMKPVQIPGYCSPEGLQHTREVDHRVVELIQEALERVLRPVHQVSGVGEVRL